MDPELVFFNPLDRSVHADPYPQYRLLREHAPLYESPLGFWLLSRYDDITAALRDPRMGHAMDETAVMLKTMVGPGTITIDEFSRWMLFRDPPDHTRLRRLVSKAFTPRAVEVLRPRIQDIVNGLVGDLVAVLADGGVADLVEGLALPLPVTVISELLGLPAEDRAQAREWAEAVAQALDPIVTEEQAIRSDAAVMALTAYLKDVIAQRRRSPGSDLLSELIAAEDEGGHLGESELISTVALLFGAGHETTRNLIGNGMLALMRAPAEMARLRATPVMIRPAIEELLRYDSPVQNTGRVAKADTQIGQWRIPKGQPVALILGAGNRDPAVFDDPDRLDVGRPDVKPLSFGGGIHFCLGAMLARLEGMEAFTALLSRAPEIEPATETLEWRPHITLRGLASLPVRAA
ncbi:MAG TPA: cytochrome P450 [Actinomycetota bacterium]|nr:cytochrome P450 [Actinomycetota bacterium]